MHLPDPRTVPPGFVFLDRLDVLEKEHGSALRRFIDAPLWEGVEALAQLASLHQRWSRDFAREAFLLSVQSLEATVSLDEAVLIGECRLDAVLLVRTEGAAQYTTLLREAAGGDPMLRMVLHIGVRAFQDAARATLLRRRYREIFQCLREQPSA